MKLKPQFEIVQANLMSRTPMPSLDICLNELLHEEQQPQSQAFIAQQKVAAIPSEVGLCTSMEALGLRL